MVNVKDHDILKTKEVVSQDAYHSPARFYAGEWGAQKLEPGNIFLSLRRRRIVNIDLCGRTMKKEFEEIVLAPDGQVAVLEKIRTVHIRSPE